MTAAEDGTEVEELDMGVVLYSCSFSVIFLMILSQVTGSRGAGGRKGWPRALPLFLPQQLSAS